MVPPPVALCAAYSPLYKRTLRRRQSQLRGQDLASNSALLAEWFAVLAELDRLVRQEHEVDTNDMNPFVAMSCYKAVLEERQARAPAPAWHATESARRALAGACRARVSPTTALLSADSRFPH